MARIRTIKPGFFANEGLSEVSEPAQILAGGLLCYADDEGYFNAHPGLVKAAVFPLREPSIPVPQMLSELARIGYVRFGTGKDSKRYGFIVKFSEHQKVSHPVPSKIKEMEIVWEVSRKIPEDSVKAPEVLRPELNGIELNGTEGELEKPSPRVARSDPRFHEFVDVLHRYHGKFVKTLSFAIWFGKRGGKQLKHLLKAEPELDFATFERCVANRARSPGVNHEQPVYEWIFHVISGPKGYQNGQTRSVSKADAREQRILERAARFANPQPIGAVDCESPSPLALPGDGRSGVCGLAGDSELIPPDGDSGSTRQAHAKSAKAGFS